MLLSVYFLLLLWPISPSLISKRSHRFTRVDHDDIDKKLFLIKEEDTSFSIFICGILKEAIITDLVPIITGYLNAPEFMINLNSSLLSPFIYNADSEHDYTNFMWKIYFDYKNTQQHLHFLSNLKPDGYKLSMLCLSDFKHQVLMNLPFSINSVFCKWSWSPDHQTMAYDNSLVLHANDSNKITYIHDSEYIPKFIQHELAIFSGPYVCWMNHLLIDTSKDKVLSLPTDLVGLCFFEDSKKKDIYLYALGQSLVKIDVTKAFKSTDTKLVSKLQHKKPFRSIDVHSIIRGLSTFCEFEASFSVPLFSQLFAHNFVVNFMHASTENPKLVYTSFRKFYTQGADYYVHVVYELEDNTMIIRALFALNQPTYSDTNPFTSARFVKDKLYLIHKNLLIMISLVSSDQKVISDDKMKELFAQVVDYHEIFEGTGGHRVLDLTQAQCDNTFWTISDDIDGEELHLFVMDYTNKTAMTKTLSSEDIFLSKDNDCLNEMEEDLEKILSKLYT